MRKGDREQDLCKKSWEENLVLSQTIPVRVNGRTAKRYRERGYKIPCEQTVDCLHHFSMELLQERHWVEIDLDLEEIRTSQNTYSFTQISLRD